MDLSGISLPTDDLSTSELTPQRRGGRRSWYSPASKSMSFQIAMEANYHDDNDENEVEILELTYFFRPPRIDFGKVKVGKTVTRTLVVKNNEDYEQEVIIEKFPVKKHFSVDLVEFMVEAKDSMMLTLSWKPTETLACREMVTLKVDDAYRLQIILIGRAEEPPKPKRKHGLAMHGRRSQLSRSRTVLGEHSAGNILQRSTGNTTKQSSKPLKSGNTRPAVSEASNDFNKPRRKSSRVTDDRPAEMQSHPIKASETYCVEHEEVTTKQVFTPSSLHRFVPNDSSLPDTPIRRTTFQKDDPDLPTTPANRMTFQKDDPNLPDTPINRMTFQKDDPNLPTTPANRMTFQKDDPNLPITPVNRMTFQKDDPNLPLTPVRRETFLKRQSAFEHQEQTLGDLSVAAGRLSCIADAGDEEDPRDSLESRIGDAGEGDDDHELFSPRDYLPDIVDTPGNLRRSITYTKLNVSRSPEKCPSSRVTPASSPPAPEIPEVCDNIIEANEMRNLSPANSVYFTPLTTPLDTPHGSDSESDHYEDSVMYLPGEGPMTPSTPLAVNPQGLRQNQHSPSTPLAGGRDYAIVTTSTTVHDVIYEEVEFVTEVSEIVKEFTETYVVSSDGQKKMIDVRENVVDHIVTTYVDTDIHERVDCGEQTVDHIVTTYVDTDTHERVDCGEGTHVIEIDQKFQHDDEFGYDQIQTGGEGNHSCHEKKIVLADMSQDSLGNDPCDSDPASSKVDTNKDAKDLASLMPPPQFIPGHISNKSPEPSSLDDWLEKGAHFQQNISPRDFKDEISPQAFLDQSTHRQNIQKLETVKVELAQRLSSTPLAAPIRFDPDEDDAMCSTRMADGLAFPTPSPIIGRRVSNATVVKDKPSLSLLSRARHDPVLQQYEPTVKDVRPLINKESDVKKSLFGGVSDSTEDLTASHAGPPHCNHHDNQHSALRTALETKVGVITSPKASHRGVPLLLKSESVSPSGKRPHSHDRETASSRLAAASTESTRKKMKPDVAQHSRPNAPSIKSQFHKAGNPKTSKPLCRTSKVAPNKVPAPTNKTLTGNKAAGMKSSGGTTKTAEATGIKPVGVATKPAGMLTKAEPEAERGMTRTMMLRRQALGVDKKAEPKKVTNPKTKKAVPLKPKSVTTGTKEETNQTSNIIKRPVKGLAQSKLTLIRNKNAAIPRHPLPFAAKNIYYDERWMQKQERGFVLWLNFILTPPEEFSMEGYSRQKVDAGKLFMDSQRSDTVKLAPTKEVLSFRAYSARRNLNNLRRSMCRMYQKEATVISKLEREVELGRIRIRKDRKIHADLGLKQKLLDMLLCYNPLWLRVGLETVYGEQIMLVNNQDILTISRFIITRLLSNPDIAEQYAHPTVPHLYREGYDDVLAQFTLKKFLLLVLVLDRAKQQRLIKHDPCLFCKDAEFKTSRNLLLVFSRDCLAGEGDLTRHLSYFGYNVSHSQTALEEFDFAVSNLATDLRCGLRITRVIEMLTQNWLLSQELRAPAISRLQKIHNVEVGLKTLTDREVILRSDKGGNIDARDIVDGHREKTLSLLWLIIFNFQVETLINEAQLREEIDFVKKNLRYKKQLTRLLADMESCGTPDRRGSVDPDLYNRSKHLSLLLRWCQAVCAHYGMKIENFTVSFSDGRALCYLLHHYQPSLLSLEAVNADTTQTIEGEEKDGCDSDDSFSSNWTITGSTEDFERLLQNEKQNFKLLYEKVRELGGVPFMVKSSDMSNTIPDEKVVITFVTFLCSRLLDIRQEVRAARVIQAAWRQHRLHAQKQTRQVQIRAARTIQTAVRDFLNRRRIVKQTQAVILIQAQWRCLLAKKYVERMRLEKKYAKEIKAVTCIQKHVRSFLARRYEQRRILAAITLQATWRGHVTRNNLSHQQDAARTIQSHYRAWKQGQTLRKQLVVQHKSAVKLQSVVRGYLARRLVKKQRAVFMLQAFFHTCVLQRRFRVQKQKVTRIAAWYKMVRERKQFVAKKKAAIIIQERFRAILKARIQQQEYLNLKQAAVCIQRFYRAAVAARLQKRISAASRIQAWFRGYQTRNEFLRIRKATVSIQCRYRALVVGREQMLMYHITRGATIIIQSWVRRYLVSQKMKRMHRAATVLQASYRRKIALEAFREKIDACLEIQRWFRSSMIVRAQQSNYLLTRIKVVKVQAVIRGFLSRKEYQNKKHAAVLIQTAFRRYQAQKSFTQKKAACAVIQNWFRESMLLRAEQSIYTLTRSKIIKIQSVVRGYLARSLYQRQRAAAVRIQSNWRSHSCQKKFMQLKKATCTIQQRYRAQVQARQQAMIFQKTKAAIVCIQRAYRAYQGRLVLEEMFAAIKMQSIWRGYKERTQFLQKREACIKIQSTWRGYTQYKSYEQKKLSCIKIQTAWRGYRERMDYQRRRTACIAIQAAWRGFKQRTSFSHQKAACIKIQSLVRGHQQWLKYQTIRGAVRVLQAKWRAVLQTRVQRIQYQIMTRSAVTIQSMIRGWIQRQKYDKLRNAVVCLQSAIRGHLTRQKVKAQHKAACLIQTLFRAYLQAKFTRMYYNTLRNSTIVIQSHYRRYQAQTLLAQHRAARTIQSFYRMYQVRKSHVHLCKSTVIIQSFVRGYLSRKCSAQKQSAAVVIQRAFRAAQLSQNVRSEYLLKKHSANIIKAWYRGYKQQRRYSSMKQGFSKLQAVVRSRKQQKQFSRLKQATCVIQRRYRALMQGRARREIYRTQHKAIITIQSAYRGYKSRCHFKQIQSAIVLQKYWRRHNTRKSFLLKRQAAVVLQKHFRRRLAYMQYRKQKEAVFCIVKRWQATLLMKQHRKQYMVKVGAAMTIQAAYKSYHQRKLFCRLKHGFTKLQAVVRGRAERKKFHALVNAASVIQKRFRALQAGRQTRNEYVSLMAASLILQTQWRMIRARRHYKQIHQAAVTIQARFRSRHAQLQYGAVKKAADVLQTHFRALLIGRKLRREFIVKQQSVILLQRAWRAALVRKQEKQHKAACRIQTAFRAYTIRRDFLGKRKAAIMIQSFVRGIMQRRQYHTLQSVVLVIQRLYRAKLATRLAQQTFHMQKRAAVTIQTMYRAHKARHSFLRIKSAAILVQTAYRAYKARQHFRQTKAAVILIQSCIRRYTAQCHYKRTINAILMIQQNWRATVQRKKAVIGYQSTRQAAIIIQSSTRGWLQRKRNSVRELGITKLQALVRGRLQRVAYRRLVLATRVLQKQYRVYIKRRSLQQEYERTLASTIKLQAHVRALQARKLYKKMKAAVVLQKHWRGVQVRNEKKQLLRSVVLVQSVIRGWIERRKHLVRVSETKAAVVIQKHWRGRQVRHQKKSMLSSIILVQSAIRGWIERKRHLVRVSETNAAVVMQKHWRGRQALHQKKRMLNSIVLIQSAVKGWLERKRHLVRVSDTKAAVVIQKHWRGRQVRHQKKRMLRSTVLVQSVVRGWIERRKHLVRMSRTKAALVIQKHWRGRQARHQKKQLLRSIVLIQSVIRGWMERKRHLVRVSETKAATTIQRMFRRHLSIKHEQEVVQKRAVHLEKYCLVTKLHLSVIHIQRAWRRRRVLIKATHQMAAVVTIQRWMKSRIQRLQYLRLLRNVRTLQRHARTYLERRHLAALRIQHCVRMWLTKQQQAKKEAAATSIQAQWRGYCVRRSTKDVKVKKARKRVQEATQKATEDQKLCNRTRSALSYLLTCKQLALVLDAVMSLDAATRLSSLCCEWMISEQAQHILFGLIKGCNRSVPHMEIIKYTVNTFLNLAKYEKTRAAVYDVDCSVEILVDLLSIYREKGGVIFTKTCTLLGLLCNNEHRRQEILSKWKIVDKILSIRALTARKHKMEKQRAVTKAKMAASRSLTNANILDTRHLRLRPDWCARRDSLREIEDPLQAIDFVMSTLELTPK